MNITDAEETVKVTLIKDGYAYVETAKASSCGSCAAKSSCGSLNFFAGRQQSGLKIRNTLNLKTGDSAVIALSSNKLLLGALLLYIFPIITLLVSAALARYFVGETGSIFFGLGGFLLSLLLVRSTLQKQKNINQFEPVLLRKIITVETQ